MECECEKSELDESFLVDQDSEDSNWVSRDVEHMEEIINPCSISPETSRKYMVFEEQLDLLISTCHTCGKKQEKLSKYESGSCVTYSYTCQCGEDFKWNSQPFSGSLPYGNLLLAASILFSGGGPTASLNVFKHLNMACISQRSYFRLQQAYMVPCIRDYYFSKQHHLLEEIREKGCVVRVAADGRCCSPGHTAKYGSYSMLDLDSKKIVATHLVQVRRDRTYNVVSLTAIILW